MNTFLIARTKRTSAMKKLAAAVPLLSAFILCPAMADEFDGYPDATDNTGKYYFAVDLASATYGGSVYPSTAGLRLAGGYNLTSMFSVEAGYAMLSSSSDNCAYGCGYYGGYGYYGYGYPVPLASYSFSSSSLQVAGIVSFPLSDAFSLSGKLGYAYNSMSYESTDNNGNPLPTISGSQSNRLYGIGAQYSLAGGIVFRAQYEDLGKVMPGIGMRMMSIGAVFNF